MEYAEWVALSTQGWLGDISGGGPSRCVYVDGTPDSEQRERRGRMIAAGYLWTCHYCNSYNRDERLDCRNCGGQRHDL
jgi:hypothetical protein